MRCRAIRFTVNIRIMYIKDGDVYKMHIHTRIIVRKRVPFDNYLLKSIRTFSLPSISYKNFTMEDISFVLMVPSISF